MDAPGDTGPAETGRKVFELRYVLEAGDFKAMYAGQSDAIRVAAGGRRSGWLGNALLLAGVFALTLSYLRLRDTGWLPSMPLAPLLLGMLLLTLGFWLWWALAYRPRYVRSLISLNGLDGVEIETVVSDAGITSRSANSSVVYRWPAVLRVQETAGQFNFWVSGIMAVIVPKRAFADAGQAAEFAAAVKEWSNGKTG